MQIAHFILFRRFGVCIFCYWIDLIVEVEQVVIFVCFKHNLTVTAREKATWKNFLIALSSSSSSSLLLLHRVVIKWKHRLVDSGDDLTLCYTNVQYFGYLYQLKR